MKYELKEISPDEITIPDRFREDYGDIEELACSIKDRGQLQPIIIDQMYNLIDGHRRLLACKHINRPIIAIIKPSESELDRKVDELVANIHRKDFTWQEECLAISRLHKALQNQKGFTRIGARGGWKLSDTANLIGKAIGTVSEYLTLAEWIKSDEEYFKEFKTKKEAKEHIKERIKSVGIFSDAIKNGLISEEELVNVIQNYDPKKGKLDTKQPRDNVTLKENGWIYILTNPSLQENLIKIGKTSRTPEERAKELSAPTGVPAEFEIVYKI
ncbi:MAG: hypothetical protein FP811_07035, partial [Desulfobacteraceae bacterium]|nr:hypothetical protein [Desulfobacteraceae bacterium]